MSGRLISLTIWLVVVVGWTANRRVLLNGFQLTDGGAPGSAATNWTWTLFRSAVAWLAMNRRRLLVPGSVITTAASPSVPGLPVKVPVGTVPLPGAPFAALSSRSVSAAASACRAAWVPAAAAGW